MTESTNPSAVRSQAEITEALLALMHQYPYSEITVKQIILEARLARKTFYRNFKSKDDVLRSMIKRTVGEYFDIVSTTQGDMLTTAFSFADRNRELLMLLGKNNMFHIILQCTNEYLPQLRESRLSQLTPSVSLFDGPDADYLMMFNIGAVWNVTALWVSRGMTDPPEKVTQMLEQYLQRMPKI